MCYYFITISFSTESMRMKWFPCSYWKYTISFIEKHFEQFEGTIAVIALGIGGRVNDIIRKRSARFVTTSSANGKANELRLHSSRRCMPDSDNRRLLTGADTFMYIDLQSKHFKCVASDKFCVRCFGSPDDICIRAQLCVCVCAVCVCGSSPRFREYSISSVMNESKSIHLDSEMFV